MRISAVLLSSVLLPAPLAGQARDTIPIHPDSLTRPVVRLREITVAASRARRDEPVGATRVEAAVIERTPAIDTYELVRQTAGLEVHDQGQGPGFASDASLRGFSSDHSTDLVRTIERMQGGRAALSGGAYGRLDASVLSGFDHGVSGGRVFGVRGMRESGWRDNGDDRLTQGHARLVHALSKATTFDGGVELYAAGWNSPGFLTLEQFDAGDLNVVADPTDGGFKRRAQERASLRVVLPDGILWRSTVYATQSRWQLLLTTPPEGGEEEGMGSQTEEEDHRYGFGLTSALTAVRGRVEVTTGLESRWDHSDYENWITTRRTRDEAQARVIGRQASGALFAQSLLDIGRHFRLSLGGRWDILATRSLQKESSETSRDTRKVLSPKLGALLHLHRTAGIYANVSRGFRQTDGVVEDPSLPVITAWSYETGIKFDSRRSSADIAFFRMDVSDEQTFDTITLESTSGGRSRRQGVEIGVRSNLDDTFALDADWTFNDARYRSLVTADGDTLSGARVFNTSKYVGSLGLDMSPPATMWNARIGTNVVGPYSPFDEPGVEVPAYALLHASGGIRIGSSRLELGVRNLLDHKYAELRAGGFVSPGQPRSVYATVRYAF